MVSADFARNLLGIIGNVISIILFLSTMPTFYRIWKNKSVERFSPIPYLVTFVNCGLWIFYGLPLVHPNSLLVTTTNGAGIIIESFYLILFIIYSDQKKRIRVLLVLLAEIIFLGVLVVLVLNFAHTTKLRSAIVGGISVGGNIMMYASPLSVMKMVITTKSVEYMPFLLSLFCFANGVCWFSYALIRFDPFVAVPNGLGALFGLAQLILYATFYKSTQEIIARRQDKSELVIGNVGTSQVEEEAATSFKTEGTILEKQILRGCLLMSRTTDSDSDHGLGPWSVRLIMSVGLGPRTRSDLLPRTRSAQYNRRLRNLPLMSDSVRSPRCLVGAFDVGLGPDSLSLVPVRRQTQSDRTQSTTIKQPLSLFLNQWSKRIINCKW
ncbi:hypothetical protein LXL04_026293 [Taraxacum kok-saghyz]